MICLIARHGHAVNVGEQGVTRDMDRPLSVTGIKQITQMGKGLKSLGLKPSLILCSPFVRTIETAKIYAQVLNDNEEITPTAFLESGARFEEYRDALNEAKAFESFAKQTIMLVGHAPDVGKVCDVMTSSKGFFFDTGNVAQIDLESLGSAGILKGFFSPSLFVHL